MNWYVKVLKNYVGFTGRARRTEFWMFTLINVIISIVLLVVDTLLGTGGYSSDANGFHVSTGLLGGIYALAVLLPSLGVAVRRLHDTDRSGWWILIAIIPLIGWIILLVFYCLEGTRGPNRHGEDPKMVSSNATAY